MTDIDESFLAERERIRAPWKHVVNLRERFVLLMGRPADKAILADAFIAQPALIAEIRRLRWIIRQLAESVWWNPHPGLAERLREFEKP